MKSAREPVATLFAIVDSRGIEGLPETFRISASSAGSSLLKITETADRDREKIMADPAIPREGRRAVAAERGREARASLAEWRAETLPRLDEQIAGAIPKPTREAVGESVLSLMFSQLAPLDPLALETLYTSPTTAPDVAAAIEQLPPRLQGGPIPTVAPRLSDEAKTKRAWAEATDDQRARAEGLQSVRDHLASACGSAEAALGDEGA